MSTGGVLEHNCISNGHHLLQGSKALGILANECDSFSAPSQAQERFQLFCEIQRDAIFWDSDN